MTKRYSIGINALFTISYIYFIAFYSHALSGETKESLEVIMKSLPEVLVRLLSKIDNFLFHSEPGMVPLFIFSFSLIAVAFLSFVLYGMGFSKVVAFLCGIGFIPTVGLVLYNAFLGPMVDEIHNIIWLTLPILLLIYLVVFQIFFIRDYKRISD